MGVSNTGQKTNGPNPQRLPGKPGVTSGGKVVGARNQLRTGGRQIGNAGSPGNNAGSGTGT